MDMKTGQIVHMPQDKAPIDQDDFILRSMRIAWRTWYINEYKLANNIGYTAEDGEFMDWLLSDWVKDNGNTD